MKCLKLSEGLGEGSSVSKASLLVLPDIKTYQKAIEIKTKWHFCRNGQVDQQVRKSPKTDICLRI